MGRYRWRIYEYGTSYLEAEFGAFVSQKAVILSASLGGTGMRVMQGGRASNAEVYVVALQARSPSGETMNMYPMAVLPNSRNAAGILGTIPISNLFIKELTSTPWFKMVFVSMDAAATNKAALRMLRTELQRHEQLLVIPTTCNAHMVNNAAKWGRGTFPYGPYFRTAHCLESALRPSGIIHAERMIGPVNGGAHTWKVTRP